MTTRRRSLLLTALLCGVVARVWSKCSARIDVDGILQEHPCVVLALARTSAPLDDTLGVLQSLTGLLRMGLSDDVAADSTFSFLRDTHTIVTRYGEYQPVAIAEGVADVRLMLPRSVHVEFDGRVSLRASSTLDRESTTH